MGDHRLSGDEQVVVGVGVEGGDAVLRRAQQLGRLVDLVLAGRVERVAEVLEGGAEGLPLVVEHLDLAGERGAHLRVEDQSPTQLFGIGDVVVAEADAGGAPLVRHRVGALGVEGRSGEQRIEVHQVGQGVVIECHQQRGIDHGLHHVVGRNHQVVGGASGVDLGQHRLVGVVEGLDDLDAELLLEPGDQIRVDVLRPVVQVEVAVGLARLALGTCGLLLAAGLTRQPACRQHQHQHQHQSAPDHRVTSLARSRRVAGRPGTPAPTTSTPPASGWRRR